MRIGSLMVPMGGEGGSGVVEADETFIGRKPGGSSRVKGADDSERPPNQEGPRLAPYELVSPEAHPRSGGGTP